MGVCDGRFHTVVSTPASSFHAVVPSCTLHMMAPHVHHVSLGCMDVRRVSAHVLGHQGCTPGCVGHRAQHKSPAGLGPNSYNRLVALCSVLETKKNSGNSIRKWVSYSHFKCRGPNFRAAFIPIKTLRQILKYSKTSQILVSFSKL